MTWVSSEGGVLSRLDVVFSAQVTDRVSRLRVQRELYRRLCENPFQTLTREQIVDARIVRKSPATTRGAYRKSVQKRMGALKLTLHRLSQTHADDIAGVVQLVNSKPAPGEEPVYALLRSDEAPPTVSSEIRSLAERIHAVAQDITSIPSQELCLLVRKLDGVLQGRASAGIDVKAVELLARSELDRGAFISVVRELGFGVNEAAQIISNVRDTEMAEEASRKRRRNRLLRAASALAPLVVVCIVAWMVRAPQPATDGAEQESVNGTSEERNDQHAAARLAWKNGDTRVAIPLIEKIVLEGNTTNDPKFFDFPFWLARYHIDRGVPNEAVGPAGLATQSVPPGDGFASIRVGMLLLEAEARHRAGMGGAKEREVEAAVDAQRLAAAGVTPVSLHAQKRVAQYMLWRELTADQPSPATVGALSQELLALGRRLGSLGDDVARLDTAVQASRAHLLSWQLLRQASDLDAARTVLAEVRDMKPAELGPVLDARRAELEGMIALAEASEDQVGRKALLGRAAKKFAEAARAFEKGNLGKGGVLLKLNLGITRRVLGDEAGAEEALRLAQDAARRIEEIQLVVAVRSTYGTSPSAHVTTPGRGWSSRTLLLQAPGWTTARPIVLSMVSAW